MFWHAVKKKKIKLAARQGPRVADVPLGGADRFETEIGFRAVSRVIIDDQSSSSRLL